MSDTIYLGAGCFWAMEKLAASLPGVVSATSGYANGRDDIVPNYTDVCRGGTGYKEVVKVEYDPEEITLGLILTAFFLVIDPTVSNRQGNDVGEQYQTGIYYQDSKSGQVAHDIVDEEAKKHSVFAVECEPLTNYFEAEEYHQKYLDKNPGGYCHIPPYQMNQVVALIEAELDFTRANEDFLFNELNKLQYDVTQRGATERPFSGPYWNSNQEGIYVDITTGQPLFSSRDKYESGCGWPAFTRPILSGRIQYNQDNSHGMTRTEVVGKLSQAHLGHVFYQDPESPNGTRYCINSASLEFVPIEDMEDAGYGPYLILF